MEEEKGIVDSIKLIEILYRSKEDESVRYI